MSCSPDRVLALAGMLQCCYLVNTSARQGMTPQDELDAMIRTLFVFDADDTVEVYGGLANLNLGTRLGADVFGNLSVGKHHEWLRYIAPLTRLASRARGDAALLTRIGAGLREIDSRYPSDASTSVGAGCINNLGDLYESTLARSGSRIQILGSKQLLQNPAVAGRIRSLLLAGFRSAILWQQLGGRRWHWLLQRGRILEDFRYCRRMLEAS
jgi:high frequency lysogenization protein